MAKKYVKNILLRLSDGEVINIKDLSEYDFEKFIETVSLIAFNQSYYSASDYDSAKKKRPILEKVVETIEYDSSKLRVEKFVKQEG